MTERIDLDDLDTGDEQAKEEEGPTRGDWFWKGEGDPADEPGAASWLSGDAETGGADDAEADAGDPDSVDSASEAAEAAEAAVERASTPGGPDSAAVRTGDDGDTARSEPTRTPASPHVPSDTPGTPAGIPVSKGGGGAGEPSSAAATGGGEEGADAETEARASGPHGGGADDMTTAFTYRAAKRLADPAAAFAEAEQWSDWVGIVGDVEAHVLGAFQRNETIDADFFNGSGTGPAERLAGIDPHSMFYADRMVVVGVEGGDEAIAEEAGWEFVSLAEAAAGAGWELRPADEGAEETPGASADPDDDS